MRYSVAIRTLAKSPQILRREFESLHNQSVLPERKYNSGAGHLDAKPPSEAYKKDSKRYYLMGKVFTLVWDRLQRQTTGDRHELRKRKTLYRLRTVWMQTILTLLGIFPAWRGCGAEFGRGVRNAFNDIATARISSSTTT